MIQLIQTREAWETELELIQESDFYFTYDYHDLSKGAEEHPVLIKYTEGEKKVLLPLLLRDIGNTEYKDATSVYGYAGVLTNDSTDELTHSKFQKELIEFFQLNKIVSVFSRLHPFMEYQQSFLKDLGTISNQGMVVNLDLTLPIEEQRAKFNRRLKTYLNKARKVCTVSQGNHEDHLDAFIHLYHENMKRVEATDSYFFDKQYFNKLMSSQSFKPELLICRENESNKIIGAAIFVKKDNIVQYHLSGLHEGYFDLNPIKLIIDEMRLKSTEEGYKLLNLGGGRGGSNEDSLFRFKSGFSKNFKEFKLWKFIVDQNKYNELAEMHFSDHPTVEIDKISFFPAYRAPLNYATTLSEI